DVSQIELIERYCDIFQVGARNMQNFTLLRELGHTRKPVLLKRGISATIEEWLLSAEYVLSGGNTDVILCERGIRTFETATRNTFDISAIPVVKKLSHLPIVADPSHGAGRRDMVAPIAPPIFDKIGIVGLGLIGGSIALKARELWPKALVIGVDNKDVLETAMRLHAIDVAADDLIVLAEADVVVLATPVRQNIALLSELDDNVRQAAVITDTGSTKRAIADAARSEEHTSELQSRGQ